MFRQFLNPPNWFTAANMFCGMYALVVLLSGSPDYHTPYRAGLFILFAMVFDMLDGRVARMTRSGSEFGTQLDSLADIISFGLAPTTLVWFWGLRPLGWVGLAVSFFFLVCGAFRLARFNLKAGKHASPESEGITITVAGTTLAVIVMANTAAGNTELARPFNAALLVLALSFLMVSKVPYRTFKTHRLSPLTIAGLSLLLGISIAVGVRHDISTVFVGLATLYILSGPLEGLVRLGLRHRVAGHPPSEDDDLPDDP